VKSVLGICCQKHGALAGDGKAREEWESPSPGFQMAFAENNLII
jgi:hypothetical protein